MRTFLNGMISKHCNHSFTENQIDLNIERYREIMPSSPSKPLGDYNAVYYFGDSMLKQRELAVRGYMWSINMDFKTKLLSKCM